MLPDSTFSLYTPNVHVAIARWKHIDTSLQTVLCLLIVCKESCSFISNITTEDHTEGGRYVITNTGSW